MFHDFLKKKFFSKIFRFFSFLNFFQIFFKYLKKIWGGRRGGSSAKISGEASSAKNFISAEGKIRQESCFGRKIFKIAQIFAGIAPMERGDRAACVSRVTNRLR